MKRTILLLLLISAPAGAQTKTESGLETANYKYVAVVIEDFYADERKIGLTTDRIQTRVELRLRSAGLTPGNDFSKNYAFFYVTVNVLGTAFGIMIQYQRMVYFTTGNRRYRKMAATWQSQKIGTHGGDAAYIMNSLDQALDTFLNEYLKVNQK